MQALGQAGRTEVRIGERRDKTLGIRITQSGKCHTARVGVAAQALDQLCEPLVAVDVLVTIGVDHEHRALSGVTGEVMQHLRAGVVGPLDVVHHENAG